MTSITLTEIDRPNDPLLLPWLDLYETAFPPEERVLTSRILRVALGLGYPGSHLLAVVDDQNAFAGLLFDYEPAEGQAAFLWYFAIDAKRRGQGLGAQVYQALLRRLHSGTRALIFDLEDPAKATDPAHQAIAARRVAFYRRQGARLLGGIHYVQRAGDHQPPLLSLRLMVHPIDPTLTPEDAFHLAYETMPEAISQTSALCWQ